MNLERAEECATLSGTQSTKDNQHQRQTLPARANAELLLVSLGDDGHQRDRKDVCVFQSEGNFHNSVGKIGTRNVWMEPIAHSL